MASNLSDPLWQINSNLIKNISNHNELLELINLSKITRNHKSSDNLIKLLKNEVSKLRSNLNLDTLKKEI